MSWNYCKYSLLVSFIVAIISILLIFESPLDQNYWECNKRCNETITDCYIKTEIIKTSRNSPYKNERITDTYYDEKTYWIIYPKNNKTDTYSMESNICHSDVTGSYLCFEEGTHICYYDGESIPKMKCICTTSLIEYSKLSLIVSGIIMGFTGMAVSL